MNYYNYPQSGRLEKKPKLFSLKEIPLLLMLFLASVNFYAYGIHIVVLVVLLYYVLAGKIHYAEGLGSPFMLTVALFFFWKDSLSGPSSIVICLVWPMAFLIGYEMTGMKTWDEAEAERTEKKVNTYILLITTGFFIHFALNFYINRDNSDLGRNTNDIWSGVVRSATGQAAIACVPVGWSVASFMNNTGIRKRIPALIVLTIVLMYNLVLSTRTLFLMVLVVALVAVIYIVFTVNKTEKKLFAVLAVLVVLIFLVLGYQYNLFNIQDYFQESEFYSRFFSDGSQKISEDSRLDAKLRFLKYMFYFLWGGGNLRRNTGNYAHDLLLDLYDEAGIIALIAAAAMVLGSIRVLLRLLKNNRIGFETRMMFLCIFSSLYLEFMVEPIFIGVPDLLMIFCFLYGVIVRMDKNLFQLQRMQTEGMEKG